MNNIERAKKLEDIAAKAWHSVAELQNQTELLDQDKKELKKALETIARLEEQFVNWQK